MLIHDVDEQIVAMVKPELIDASVRRGELGERVAQHLIAAAQLPALRLPAEPFGHHGWERAVALIDGHPGRPAARRPLTLRVDERVVDSPRQIVLVARRQKLCHDVARFASLPTSRAEWRGFDGVLQSDAFQVSERESATDRESVTSLHWWLCSANSLDLLRAWP